MQYCVKHTWPMTEKEVDNTFFCKYIGLYVGATDQNAINGYCFCPEKIEQCEKERNSV